MLVDVLAKIEKLRRWQTKEVEKSAEDGENAASLGDNAAGSGGLKGETHGVIEEIAEFEHMILTDLARGNNNHDVNVAEDQDTHTRLEGALNDAGIDSTVASRWKK